ncbi:conjugal transfer protein TrbD, partial [Escherichia coli]
SESLPDNFNMTAVGVMKNSEI